MVNPLPEGAPMVAWPEVTLPPLGKTVCGQARSVSTKIDMQPSSAAMRSLYALIEPLVAREPINRPSQR
ncbi:hypothetical protein GCM10007857_87120 [Bradyrhizobium iriomotense]|uniref:Uncharacterized protein n=1 Tax=Bradyrhizobium iriomotense TaxID=441950 RepID=A0ABQ6BC38_9BRAD|nr:hypothetical protein GCM10007857_87120 [Bradyrhizobium iriomotense]